MRTGWTWIAPTLRDKRHLQISELNLSICGLLLRSRWMVSPFGRHLSSSWHVHERKLLIFLCPHFREYLHRHWSSKGFMSKDSLSPRSKSSVTRKMCVLMWFQLYIKDARALNPTNMPKQWFRKKVLRRDCTCSCPVQMVYQSNAQSCPQFVDGWRYRWCMQSWDHQPSKQLEADGLNIQSIRFRFWQDQRYKRSLKGKN